MTTAYDRKMENQLTVCFQMNYWGIICNVTMNKNFRCLTAFSHNLKMDKMVIIFIIIYFKHFFLIFECTDTFMDKIYEIWIISN